MDKKAMRPIDANELLEIAEQQGYVTVDDIIDATMIAPRYILLPERARLDRSRWERCNACQAEAKWCKRWKFKYCPFCGRPLAEEAWAELERRIGGNDGKTD